MNTAAPAPTPPELVSSNGRISSRGRPSPRANRRRDSCPATEATTFTQFSARPDGVCYEAPEFCCGGPGNAPRSPRESAAQPPGIRATKPRGIGSRAARNPLSSPGPLRSPQCTQGRGMTKRPEKKAERSARTRRVATPTRTINPLPWSDLDPRRFEDLVRQLVHRFRPWRMNDRADGPARERRGHRHASRGRLRRRPRTAERRRRRDRRERGSPRRGRRPRMEDPVQAVQAPPPKSHPPDCRRACVRPEAPPVWNPRRGRGRHLRRGLLRVPRFAPRRSASPSTTSGRGRSSKTESTDRKTTTCCLPISGFPSRRGDDPWLQRSARRWR